MRILIIGGHGNIGRSIAGELQKRHQVITAGRNSGQLRVDISSEESIGEMFDKSGPLDACICTAGTGFYGDFQTMAQRDLMPGIYGKLLGQINVVLIGKRYLGSEGSFTLTSGIAAEHPAKNGAGVAMVNGAINSFVLAAAQELKKDMRINVVSPGLVGDPDNIKRYGHLFPGYNHVPVQKVINAYVLSVEGAVNGQILKVYS